MPWKVFGTCVHKLDENGNKSELVKCHQSAQKAAAHVRALYTNVSEETKELLVDAAEYDEIVMVKETDGGYDITSVSTAAIEDREGETFTVEAIDYDIAQAKETGKYPEYRVFHSPLLGFGKVTKMYRVGIFAIEEGKSYTDDFSLAICKQLLSNHDGKWRTSRGFNPIEVESNCRNCSRPIGIAKEHMVVGYRCPHCNTVHATYKGMKNVQYKKAITFDITATDIPAVPMTGMSATHRIQHEVIMTKEQLKRRLLDAGLADDIIETRLKSISDEQLKEYEDLPIASVLKELDEETADGNVMYLDESSFDALKETVTVAVKELLESAEIIIEDQSFKEDGIAELKEEIKSLHDKLDQLLADDASKLKELNTPAARNRLRIYKEGKKMSPSNPAEEEEEEEEEDMEVSKDMQRWLRNGDNTRQKQTGIKDGQGNTYASMTEFLTGA